MSSLQREQRAPTNPGNQETKLSWDQGGARGGIPGLGLCGDLCLNTTSLGPNPSLGKSKQLLAGSLSRVWHHRAPESCFKCNFPWRGCTSLQQAVVKQPPCILAFNYTLVQLPRSLWFKIHLPLPAELPAVRADLSSCMFSLLFCCQPLVGESVFG